MSPVLDVPVDRLATTLAPLRGPRTAAGTALAPLPVRVAPVGDGTYHVLDGFKRLARWRREGHPHIPVVVEADAFSSVVGKARLLEANTPKRTVSPMDEARVVHSLAADNQLSPTQITKLLGRGRGWVDRRLTLGRRLRPEPARHLDAGRLSATTAHALASLPRGEQPRLAEAIVRHGLRTREAEAMLATWRAASDTPLREALLRDPRSATPAPGAPAVSPLGPTAHELQARFLQTEHALQELAQLDLTGFPDPDHRVLAACQRRLVARIIQLAHTFQKEHPRDADPRGTGRTATSGARPHPDPRHGPAPESRRQDHPPSFGPVPEPPGARAVEAGALPRADHGAGAAGPARPADPARASGPRLPRRPDDLESFAAHPAPTPATGPPPRSPLRDPAGGGSPVGLESLSRDDRHPRDDRARLQSDPLLLPPSVRGLLPRRAPADAPLGTPGAFRYHQGLCRRIAYDNQTAITLGRVGGQPRWHPPFLDFAAHYGFEPSVGRPGHKERRGKVERPFHYLEHDFLAGRAFASWDALNTQCRQWLDTVANVRVHGTTRRRVDEAFAEEQPCLIALPALRYPAAREETRTVQKDGYIPVDGSYYPVPAPLGNAGAVNVRIDPAHVQILDAAGDVVATHRVREAPTRLPAPAPLPGQHRGPRGRSRPASLRSDHDAPI